MQFSMYSWKTGLCIALDVFLWGTSNLELTQDHVEQVRQLYFFILDVFVSPNRKYVNLSLIYYILDFSSFMSQDDAYFHIHQNDPI